MAGIRDGQVSGMGRYPEMGGYLGMGGYLVIGRYPGIGRHPGMGRYLGPPSSSSACLSGAPCCLPPHISVAELELGGPRSGWYHVPDGLS
jgi:hypothetical protein